jgi:hypothetical protein
MQNWKLTCEDGFTKETMANSKEEAVRMFMEHPEVQEHVKTSHPDMAMKSPEDMTTMIMGMVTQVQEMPNNE